MLFTIKPILFLKALHVKSIINSSLGYYGHRHLKDHPGLFFPMFVAFAAQFRLFVVV